MIILLDIFVGMVLFAMLLFLVLLLSYIIGLIFSKLYPSEVERTMTDHISNGFLTLLIAFAIIPVTLLFLVLGILARGGTL